MQTPKPYKAVFFDLGGTLFHHLPPQHTEHNLLRGFADFDAVQVIDRYRQHRRQVEREALNSAFYMHRGLVAEALARTQAEFGFSNREAAQTFCDAQANSVTAELHLREDTVTTLQTLRRRDYYTAIVSNIDDNYIVPLLKRTGLAQYFDYWISSERARSCKPHAGIFTQALQQAQIDPSEVLFVGDSVPHDVVGAQRLGMGTALLTVDHASRETQGADYGIVKLSELLEILA